MFFCLEVSYFLSKFGGLKVGVDVRMEGILTLLNY